MKDSEIAAIYGIRHLEREIEKASRTLADMKARRTRLLRRLSPEAKSELRAPKPRAWRPQFLNQPDGVTP